MSNNNDYITRTISSSTYCSGTDRYCDVEVQVSYDNGSTWTTSSITPTFIDHKASECIKVAALNASGHVIGMVACDGSTSLTSGEINAALDNFHCSVTSIVFCGCTVTSIGDYVLRNYRNLTSVTIPSSVTTIGSDFLGGYTVSADGQYRKLRIDATTPPTLTSGSLGGLPNVIEVPCSGLYYYLNDVNWSKYYNKIQPIENCDEPPTPSNVKLFCIYLAGTAEKLSSGTTLCDGSTVINKSSINSAMGSSSSKLKEILIGNCVTSISASTFAGSGFNLLKVYISDSVTSIGNSAFAECRAIANIVIPSGVTSISDYTFQSCQSLSSVTLPSGLTSIGNKAFDGCSSLTSFTIPDNVTSIGNGAFNGCNKISSINIPSGITTIGDGAFCGCRAITDITIPSGVTSINDAVFYECSALESVTIPGNITSIGQSAFEDCTGLTSVDIPSGVTSIGGSAFYGCNSLTSITVEATTPPALGNYAFYYTNNAPIYVPCQSVDAYKSASGWSNYASRIQCIFKFKATYNDSSTLSAECDSNTTLTTAVTKPSGYQASGMTSAIIGDCITTIDTIAFNGCSSLSSITIPDSVTSIGNWSFTACVSLSSLTIPDSVTNIGEEAFYWCTSLTSVTIPDSVTSIGHHAFANCGSLTNCTIGNGVTYIDFNTFDKCSGLTSVTIPDSVTSIGSQAFDGCISLTSVTIPDSVASINSLAFRSCSGLTSIIINSSTPPAIGDGAFYNTTAIIYVPCDSINAYVTASGWSDYASRIRGIAPCFKWKASYSGGTTTSAECDATGEIVQYEIAGNKLIGLEIGTCVTRIGDKMLFNYINFDGSITIPDSVTSIGDSVFFNCKKLRTVTIGSGVTSMGNDVFFACDNLSTVTINAVVPPTLGTEAFDESSCQIKVPSGSVNAYKSATNWSTYASRITSI